MRLADLGREIVLRQRGLDPRHEVSAIRGIVGMLQLAPAAFGKMPARRLLVMRPEGERTVVEHRIAGHAERYVPAAWRHAVAARGNADDQLVHRSAMARGMAATRSSAIICGPAISAARPCSHTPVQAASKLLPVRDMIAAISPASTSPEPALAR